MTLLTILTLIYALILVLALAASLIAILIYLRRVAGSLGEARAALEKVSHETEPLHTHFQQLQDTSGGSAEALKEAQSRLERLDERLGVLTEPQEVTTSGR